MSSNSLLVANSIEEVNGITRIGGAPLFKVERRAGGTMVSFRDHKHRGRVADRGGQECVYVDIDQLIEYLERRKREV